MFDFPKPSILEAMAKDGRIRKNILIGASVQVVLKMDQSDGKLTKGVVEEILTPAAKHPHGIKVKLKSGHIGRVRKILSAKKNPYPDQILEEPPSSKGLLPWEKFKPKS